jgi:hypothetical protein
VNTGARFLIISVKPSAGVARDCERLKPQYAQCELRGDDVCERLQGFWMGAPGRAFLMTGDFSSDLNGPDFSTESTENNW